MDTNKLQNEIKSNEAVMVYLSGEDCGVCQVLQPKVKESMDKNFPKIKQIYISAQEFKQTAASLGVFTIPTIIVYIDGKEFVKQSRHISIPNLEQAIKRPYELYFQ